MGDHAVGKVRDPERVDTLLKEVEGWAKVRVRSTDRANMPDRMSPLTINDEKEIVETIGGELKVKFGVRVSGNLLSNRKKVGGVNHVFKYVTMGEQPWQAGGGAEGVEVKIGEDRVIIFYGMDNGVFDEEDDNVNRSSPNQMQRGCIMKGKLVLATQKQIRGLTANCKPVMDRISGNRKFILSSSCHLG